MTYVVQQPNSNTNGTSKYVVSRYSEVIKAMHTGLPVKSVSSHTTGAEAKDACDELNRAEASAAESDTAGAAT